MRRSRADWPNNAHRNEQPVHHVRRQNRSHRRDDDWWLHRGRTANGRGGNRYDRHDGNDDHGLNQRNYHDRHESHGNGDDGHECNRHHAYGNNRDGHNGRQHEFDRHERHERDEFDGHGRAADRFAAGSQIRWPVDVDVGAWFKHAVFIPAVVRQSLASHATSSSRGHDGSSNGRESRGSWTSARGCNRAGKTRANTSRRHATHPVNDDTAGRAKLDQPDDAACAGESDAGANSESATDSNSESGTDANSESGAEPGTCAKSTTEPESRR